MGRHGWTRSTYTPVRLQRQQEASPVQGRQPLPVRIALFMPALSAARHDPNVRAYYQHLIKNRDLKKLQARCAVMRKLLHAIHAMLKNRTPFDSRRFYIPTETTTD